MSQKGAVFDEILYKQLLDLRKKVAKQAGVAHGWWPGGKDWVPI